MLPGFRHVPFGDIDAIKQQINDDTAAIMVEPIQGEGGVRIPSRSFLADLRQLCDEHNLLLIFDEVQTGMGRTGKWFAHQHFGIEPDIMTLAKALGGGIAVGAMLAKPKVAEALKPGMHAATFGGNPIACRAGLATIETIEAEGLLERAKHIEQTFRQAFESLKAKHHAIKEVRAFGAMIGIELNVPGVPVVNECLKQKLLINCTQEKVIRLLPALNITDEQMAEGIAILSKAIGTVT